MNRQRARRRTPLAGLSVIGCAFALGLPAAAQEVESDPFFGDYVPFEEGEVFGQATFEQQTYSASGEIDRVDLAEGRLVIDGRTYRADPRALEGLRPGQHVSLLYEPIEDQAWISELQVGEGSYGGDPFFGF